ncbi:hypothetical protein NVS55_28750 [Myxococcus stipitatus]|uniref:hypothetical protein n=1 Tax=Myxococcus stipitatus TaxID=83455 RepID=UPI003145299A
MAWLLCFMWLTGCASRGTVPSGPSPATALDSFAEQYVKLVLALGQHDPALVDAYHGPQRWADEAKHASVPLAEVGAHARALHALIESSPVPADPLVAMRRTFLLRQVGAMDARARLLQGEKLSFDEESEALYNARAPTHTEAEFARTLAELEQLLPGQGTLAERLEVFHQGFVIPPEKLRVVFQTAIDEARRRTKQHIPLPDDEAVTLEFVTGQSWGAYNWYKGHNQSVVQINTDLPITISRAIEVGAHESYPGHHVYNVLLEQHLVRERGWVEFTIYPLYSPQSLISEGSATYGPRVVFPDEAAYLREVLFPLAGLPPDRVEPYLRVEALLKKLSYVDNEAARRFLDGRFTREQASDYLIRYRLLTRPQVEKFLLNVTEERTYLINYNLGRDLVADFIERRGGTKDNPNRGWELLRELLSSPRLPGDLIDQHP